MSSRFYTNLISEASRNFAAGVFIVGMLLIGFGFLIWLLRELFAMLFAVLFCIVGIGCLVTAVKIFFFQRRLNKLNSDDASGFRENVNIHIEEHHDM